MAQDRPAADRPPSGPRRALNLVYDAAGALAGLFVLAILVMMIGQSVLREFGVPTGPVNDVVAWSCAAAAFLAMAHTFRHGDFVRVTLLLEKLGPAARRRVELVCLAVAAASVGYLAVSVIRFVYESWAFNDIASGQFAAPLWIPQSSFVIGAVLLLVAIVDELVRVWRGCVPVYVEAVEKRHAEGDFSADL
ncbi:TRAP transporter small permease [Piscinibacter sp. XHJ-5]|uniref:TRAP transporter small permease n=1 Tax=Piscinibacter sp. XHJ-5 TaxID=3037797 RepID=UPI0024536E58|nr:TRAP transporter small permease [Piscinibacter sp. XHJ-5]